MLLVRRDAATEVVVVLESTTVRKGLRMAVVVVVCLRTTPSNFSLISLTRSFPLGSVVPGAMASFALFSGLGTSPRAARLRLPWAAGST